MPGFIFKFEPVLNQRKIVEDERQRELAQLLREQMIIERRLRDMQQEISQDKQSMQGVLVGRVDVSRIRGHAAHANRMTVSAQQMAVKLFSIHKQVETSRQRLTKAMADRKAIELLRDKQLARWRSEMDRRQTAELDDLSAAAYIRRARETR